MGGGIPGGEMPMPGMPPASGGVPPEAAGLEAMLQQAPTGGQPLTAIEGGQGLISLEDIKMVLQGIAKLRGQVYIVGAVLTGNLAKNEELELMITNPLDKATIINALRNAYPELDGRIQVHPTKGVPNEDNEPVNAGTEVAV